MDKKELVGAVSRIVLWVATGALTSLGVSATTNAMAVGYLNGGGAEYLATGIITGVTALGWYIKSKIMKGNT